MERVVQLLRDFPAVAGIGFFLAVSVFLAVVLGVLMHRAGVSLKPLVFFFGFLAIVGGPQAAVHLVNAYLARPGETPPDAPLRPVAWDVVFGPGADPDLMTDARGGLEAVLAGAVEAKLSFSVDGGSALAARFEAAPDAAAALDAYVAFFQFDQASGSAAAGWTGRRFGGQGEWNHAVAAGNELYAWTGPTRGHVEAHRVRALGPIPAATASPSNPAVSEPATERLTDRKGVLAAFVAINLLMAVFWFFKASAWSARIDADAGARPVAASVLRERLAAVDRPDAPLEVKAGADGKTVEVGWRYADARWFDLMRLHRMRRTHRLVLMLDESNRRVRVAEYWSAFDASAGADGLRLGWQAATGMQFFNFEHRRTYGVQLDAAGKPTGDLGSAYTFNLQGLKGPIIAVVTAGGWTWQPVMWNAPAGLRWLTE